MAIVVTKDMGLTHRDFYRTFPLVAGEWAWQVSNNIVTLDHPMGLVTIYLEPERRRKIALISLPATNLRLEFATEDQAAVNTFIKHFDTHFRRGGG